MSTPTWIKHTHCTCVLNTVKATRWRSESIPHCSTFQINCFSNGKLRLLVSVWSALHASNRCAAFDSRWLIHPANMGKLAFDGYIRRWLQQMHIKVKYIDWFSFPLNWISEPISLKKDALFYPLMLNVKYYWNDPLVALYCLLRPLASS